MYVLIHKNDTIGPFGSKRRALEYAGTAGYSEFEVKPLIVPYSVVKQIVWRSNDN